MSSTTEKINSALVSLWIDGGARAITYGTVVTRSGVSRGSVQNQYKSSSAMLCSAAKEVSESLPISWSAIAARTTSKSGLSISECAVLEATAYLNRQAQTDG